MQLNFKKVIDIEIDSDSEKPAGLTYVGDSSSHEVSYMIDIDNREWGIKGGVTISSSDQEILISILVEDDSSNDTKTCYFKVSVKDIDTEYQGERSLSDDIDPETLHLILKNIVKIDDDNYTADADGCLYF